MTHYLKDEDITYIDNRYAKKNVFIKKRRETVDIPAFEEIKDKLPEIVWEGNESAVNCYYKAWELVWKNIHNPMCSAFVSPFVDAAFNDCIFMWDSCFMLMFGKYADKYFPFQKTLDNFYALQHRDGFIGREISEKDGSEKFSRHDPSGTGPNIMAWCEYEYYKFTGDIERLNNVFEPLLAYHQWLKNNRTWKDGSYFSSGWGCGMDNMPRLRGNDDKWFSHNHMTWCDTCMQQLLNCRILIKIAAILKRDDIDDIIEEQHRLSLWVNANLWDDATKYYYDLWNNGELNMIKSVGAYWALLAETVPQERKNEFIRHLNSTDEFMRPNCVPTLSADCKYYSKRGNYWCGSVWAPTNYMVLKGLEICGEHDLAYIIAERAVGNAVKVFENTGTLWENYSPETAEPGEQAKSDFVGWSGNFPISMLIEFLFGITYDAENNEITWRINMTDRFGIKRYPVKNGEVDLICGERENISQIPEIFVSADTNVRLKIIFHDSVIHKEITPGGANVQIQ